MRRVIDRLVTAGNRGNAISEIPETDAESARGTIFGRFVSQSSVARRLSAIGRPCSQNLGPFDERERGEALKMPGSNR